jgi:hypothetical protein
MVTSQKIYRIKSGDFEGLFLHSDECSRLLGFDGILGGNIN